MRRLVVVAALLLMAAGPEETQRTLDERQALMKDMRSALGEYVPMLKGERPWEPAAVRRPAERLRAGIIKSLALYPEGTSSERMFTMALPTIWEKWPEFEAAARAGESAALRLTELAPSRDGAALAQQVEALSKTCTDCHQTFRMRR
jgi:cytochrome c556